MIKSGLAFHVHHNKLIEYCYDYDERVAVIEKEKCINEIPTRLRLFQLLPESVSLPEDVRKAEAEWKKAEAEMKKARAERRKAYAEWRKAYAEWSKAFAEWRKAYAEWRKACAEVEKTVSRNIKFFEKLHTELCGCKEWDGKQIVFLC